MSGRVDIDEEDVGVNAGVRELPVAVIHIHPLEAILERRQRFRFLCLRQLVYMGAHHNDGGFGSAAFDVLQPQLEALEALLTIHDTPEQEVQRATGEEALVSGVVLLLTGEGGI